MIAQIAAHRTRATNPTYTFTRPADTTAYASGDLVANNTSAGSVVPMSWVLGYSAINAPFTLKRVRLSKSGTTATSSAFRVHFYGASPTVANGDNGAWSTDTAAKYLGHIDVTGQGAALTAFTDGCAGWGALTAGSEASIKLTSGATIYGLIEARGT